MSGIVMCDSATALVIGGVFYAGAACYVAAAIMTVRYLRGDDDAALAATMRWLMAGAGLLVATLVLRWLAWRLIPLTTMVDSINLFAILSTMAIIFVVRQEQVATLLCFYVPPLATAMLINAAFAHQALYQAPRALRGLPLALHVGLVFLAYALFFLASMTSAAYLFQADRLKRRQFNGLFQRLPSLEQLDRSLWRLVVYGYPLFVSTLVLGFVWAFLERELLETRWYLAPKVVFACGMVIFYAVLVHMRLSGRLRGPKLAQAVFWGFMLMLAAYFVLGLANLREYHFWGGSL